MILSIFFFLNIRHTFGIVLYLKTTLMLKKIIIGLAVFFILAIGTIIAIPFLFKDEINAAIKEEINNSLNAKVDYGKYDLSLLRSFPNFSFQLSEFSIVGSGRF
jgi:hypothetical protein